MFGKNCNHPGNTLRCKQIIGTENFDKLSGGVPNTAIQVFLCTDIHLVTDVPDAMISGRVLFNDFSSCVGRTVIDNYQLKIAKGLSKYRLNRIREKPGIIVRWNADRYRW